MSGPAWFGIFSLLGAEAAVVLLMAASAAKFSRPVWQRTLWHGAMIMLLGLLAMESFGVGTAITTAWRRSNHSGVTRQVVVQMFSTPPEIQTFGVTAGRGSESLQIRRAGQAPLWWPGGLWLAGIALFLVRPIGSRLAFFLLRKRRQPVHNQELRLQVEALARRLGLSGRILISECESIQGPIAFGIFRRGICFPMQFADAYSRRQQEAMLAHELEHLRSRDPAWYLLTEIIAAVWWWHPLAWWARRNLQAATEQAADEAALLVEGGPVILAECLVQIGRRLGKFPSFNLLGIEGNGFRSGLGRRVTRLLRMHSEMRRREIRPWRRALVYSMSIAGLIVVTVAAASVSSNTGAEHPSVAQAIIAFQQNRHQPDETTQEPAGQFARTEAEQAKPPGDSQAHENSGNVLAAGGYEPGAALHKRYFRVDPNTFAQNLAKKLENRKPELQAPKSASSNLLSQFVPLLTSLGIDLAAPKNILYNETQGLILAQATLQDLDAIEFVLQELNQSPPQLTIECQIVEFSYNNPPHWFSGEWTNHMGMVQPATASSTNLAGPELVSILTPAQSREIFQDLKARQGCDFLSAPKVTTLSGREAEIKIVEIKSLFIPGENPSEKNGKPKIEQFELGPSINLVPLVAADGVTISISIVPSMLEFLGQEPAAKSKNAQAPMFRFRKAQTRVVLWDGQTALLGLGPVERVEKSPRRDRVVYRAVFVTPTIIDPAGNRVHPEDQLPFRNESVPRQP